MGGGGERGVVSGGEGGVRGCVGHGGGERGRAALAPKAHQHFVGKPEKNEARCPKPLPRKIEDPQGLVRRPLVQQVRPVAAPQGEENKNKHEEEKIGCVL
jgi:hypothetical protein